VSGTTFSLERARSQPSWARRIDRWARRAVRAGLSRIEQGSLTFVEGGERETFGPADSPLAATIVVDDPRLYRLLALRGPLGGAEAYLEGLWRCDDPTAVVRILARNRTALEALEGGLARLARPGLRALHALRRNTRGGSRRNIAAHYDLGNEFFSLFLDPTLTYSCGIFEHAGATLEEASVAKYERACRRLGLGPGDHVLEIGGGWGGFALHAARRHGCRVTTTTISRAQHELALRRVAEAGLSEQVSVLLRDYRDLEGTHDALVSIEMIEAVGHAQLDAFFRVATARLRPGGRMFLQAIVVPERDYERSIRSVDFVKRHVFPGGQLVSLGAICGALARTSDLRVTQLEDITAHYAETLRRWRERFLQNLDRIRALGLGERFLRLWEFYLCYCEGAFRERANGAVQIVLERPAHA
jgi:cyclopropane-fatty-acyl-phospholipid synthase